MYGQYIFSTHSPLAAKKFILDLVCNYLVQYKYSNHKQHINAAASVSGAE